MGWSRNQGSQNGEVSEFLVGRAHLWVSVCYSRVKQNGVGLEGFRLGFFWITPVGQLNLAAVGQSLWGLGFGAFLEFGIWLLEFSSSLFLCVRRWKGYDLINQCWFWAWLPPAAQPMLMAIRLD